MALLYCLTGAIVVLEIGLGFVTSRLVQRTSLGSRWAIYVAIWTILVSFVTLQLLECILYVDAKIKSDFNGFQARIIVALFHNFLIYCALGFIIFYVNSINKHTVEMMRLIEEEKKAMNKRSNRRTANFRQSARPTVGADGKVVLQESPEKVAPAKVVASI